MALATAAATTATACAPASTFPLARSGIHPARPTLAAMSFVDSAPVLADAAEIARVGGEDALQHLVHERFRVVQYLLQESLRSARTWQPACHSVPSLARKCEGPSGDQL